MIMALCALGWRRRAKASQTGVGINTNREAIEIKGNKPTFKLNNNPISSVINPIATSARAQALNQGENSKLLQSKYGSQVKLSVSVDPELIGGIRISVGDEVMDASVREKLSKMTVALLN